jgi:Spy/CpxP family protein refolding chaperone
MVMNKTKLLSIAVICLVLLNLGMITMFLFNGKPPQHQGGPEGEGPKKIIIERLNFDEGQQKQYEGIITEHRSKTKELNKRSRELYDELYSLLKNDTIDKTISDSLIKTITENQKAKEDLNFDHFQKIKVICKGPQLENFNGLVLDLTHLFGPKNGPPK